MEQIDYNEVVEVIAEVVAPTWFAPQMFREGVINPAYPNVMGLVHVYNTYPEQHKAMQEKARIKARAIIELVKRIK